MHCWVDVASTLQFLTPVLYQAATNPVAFVYHVDWPGNDLLNPVFHAYKVNVANNVVTELGTFHTVGAAQSACQTDYTGPATLFKPPKTVYA